MTTSTAAELRAAGRGAELLPADIATIGDDTDRILAEYRRMTATMSHPLTMPAINVTVDVACKQLRERLHREMPFEAKRSARRILQGERRQAGR